VDLLIVYLTQDTKLHRARTALRNFVADHLKQRAEKDAALVAFVSPSEHTWRFSLVKMDYTTLQNEHGQVLVSEHLTPARRYSYLVGEGESCHTAQSRFLGLLQDTATDPTLEEIDEAFSVETVTNTFLLSISPYSSIPTVHYKNLSKRMKRSAESLRAKISRPLISQRSSLGKSSSCISSKRRAG
jgi:hypothetical protein